MRQIVVVVPIFGLTQELPDLINTLVKTVTEPHKVILIDDCSNDSSLSSLLTDIRESQISNVEIWINTSNLGYLTNVNRVINEYTKHDVIAINSDVLLDISWFERIRRVAETDNTISTISVWSNKGSFLSIPFEGLDSEYKLAELSRINKLLGNLNPPVITIPVAVGHLIYLRRGPLNLLHGYDRKYGHGYGEEVDYSLRAMELGFRNVVAPNIFVFHQESESSKRNHMFDTKVQNDILVEKDYPYYSQYLQEMLPRVELLKSSIKNLIGGASVAIDGSCFSYAISGTSQITLAIIENFSLISHYRVTVILDTNVEERIFKQLLANPRISVEFFSNKSKKRFDIFWRPYQIWESEKLAWIRENANDFVLGIQDFIAFDNISYHQNADSWIQYRAVMADSMRKASALTFISDYSFERARDLGLINPNFNEVIPNGVNHVKKNMLEKKAVLQDRKILLLGHDFKHKNYEYCVKLLTQLAQSGLKFKLVHIGKSSETLKTLLNSPNLNFEILELGELGENEKTEVLKEVSLALYLSTVEGFGLIPFELAFLGVPTFYVRQGGAIQFTPDVWDMEITWDLQSDVKKIVDFFMQDMPDRYIKPILDSSISLTWERNIARHNELFQKILLQTSLMHGGDLRSELKLEYQEFRPRLGFKNDVRKVGNLIFPFGTRRRQLFKRLYNKAFNILNRSKS